MIARVPRPSFSPRPGERLPQPFRGRALRRRQLMFREARQLLPFLPEREGDATHALLTGRCDLMVVVSAVVDVYGSECHLRLATLSFNQRNTLEMLELLNTGKVTALTLLASSFFKAHNRQEFAEARRAAARFPGRWKLACSRNHAKVCLLDFGAFKLVMEGSANLRSNGNHEQLVVIRDAGLHSWHSRWIDAEVSAHETDEAEDEEMAEGE